MPPVSSNKILETQTSEGRTRDKRVCPFCERSKWVYRWAAAGSGSRCDNAQCDGMFVHGGAIRKPKFPKIGKVNR